MTHLIVYAAFRYRCLQCTSENDNIICEVKSPCWYEYDSQERAKFGLVCILKWSVRPGPTVFFAYLSAFFVGVPACLLSTVFFLKKSALSMPISCYLV